MLHLEASISISTLLIITFGVCSGQSNYDQTDFVFPGQDNRAEHSRNYEIINTNVEPRFNNNSISEIPFDLAKKLSEVESFEDIINNLVEGDLSFFHISNRFSGDERSGITSPKPANCKPSPVIIDLAKEATNLTVAPGDLLLPACTRVERCTGCSGNSLLACKPTATEMQLFQVIHVKYTGGPKLKLLQKVVVPVEIHTKCALDCAVSEKDCASFQEYRHSECQCVCTNSDEKKKCEKQFEKKLWDPKSCRCTCREEKSECTTGLRWDERKCKCVRIAQRRRFVQYNSTKATAPDRRNKYEINV